MDEDSRKKAAIKAAALSYVKGRDRAPRVSAKGRGLVAERIIELAKEHGVPVREDRALVEALSLLELNQEIPAELYKAVAEVLAFIYLLQRKRTGKGL